MNNTASTTPASAPSVALLVRVFNLVFLLSLSYNLYRGLYNRYFHPLRRFPGPFWGSVSDFFKLWILHTKQAHTLGLDYHEKYGPVVRAAPNLLAVNDPLLLSQIYHRKVDKTDVYTTGVLGDLAPPFQTIKHEEQAAKRKRVANSVSLMSPGLSFFDLLPTSGYLARFEAIIRLVNADEEQFLLINLKPLEGQIDARIMQ